MRSRSEIYTRSPVQWKCSAARWKGKFAHDPSHIVGSTSATQLATIAATDRPTSLKPSAKYRRLRSRVYDENATLDSHGARAHIKVHALAQQRLVSLGSPYAVGQYSTEHIRTAHGAHTHTRVANSTRIHRSLRTCTVHLFHITHVVYSIFTIQRHRATIPANSQHNRWHFPDYFHNATSTVTLNVIVR